MVTALYRRYRPENFAELIGQSQVTDPLRTALRTNRVNHAYLFSGPRGCGKTTSARILARCLNCAEGPTDTPCGVCPSCVELARGGSGSLDVIEIDAASHNGVDDARDLRDRAVFAPARDRYKIFILDEAHMVTPQGFNALLKLVEEPPEHVKFIFATTEPEKVIGTIRSRTHHYPFRLVPPAAMLEYVEQLCTQESVTVAPGVLPLVVRAGGGSVRDTLSLLDQLIAGSEDGALRYERAVALLGYTDSALLDDVVDALAVADPSSAFAAVDRVVQTGQDPRRFVEDLLERLRDLIVVAATNESAGAVLRGVSPEELDTMSRQAGVFGATGLSRGADIANRALTDMTGATSPRLHLELMVARMLVPEADDSQRGALARVERLERRVGVGDAGGHSGGPAVLESAPPAAAPVRGAGSSVPASSVPASSVPASSAMQPVRQSEPVSTTTSAPDTIGVPSGSSSAAAKSSSGAPSSAVSSAASSSGDAADANPAAASAAQDAAASWAAVAPGSADSSGSSESSGSSGSSAPSGSSSTPGTDASPTSESTGRTGSAGSAPSEHASSSSTGQGTVIGSEPAVRPIAPVGLQQMRDAWTQVLDHVQHAKRSAWTVVVTAQVTALRDDVLTLTFPSQQDVASFKEMADPATSVSELVRAAILDVLGFRVKFVARGPGGAGGPGQQRPAEPPRDQPVAAAQRSAPAQAAPASTPVAASAPAPAPTTSAQRAPVEQVPVDHAPFEQTPERPASAQQAPSAPAATAPATPPQQEEPRSAPEQPAQQQAEPRPSTPPQAESTPAVEQAPVSNDPVTEWAVATIPSTDPSTGAVPEGVEPAWGAPFGSTGPSDTVAPTTTTAPDAAAPTRASSADAVPAAGSTASTSSTSGSSASGTRDGQRASAGSPGAAPGADVPVDDYPMDDGPFDDGPYDDGAPFPDPGFGGRAAGPAPTQSASAQPASAPAQQAPTQQAPARQAPAQQPRRAPVPGRYGEAVVREILGAQFIEETTLSEGN